MSLAIGETKLVQGSANDPYKVKNVDGKIYSCTCFGWKNSKGSVDQKTCKHVKAERGAVPGAPAPVAQAPVVTATSKTAGDSSRGNCLLAHDWDGEMDPKGWHMSIKFDGLRALWDGQDFWSRENGVTKKSNKFEKAPDWFKQGMPNMPLDGELYQGRKLFQKTISAVKGGNGEWRQLFYKVFDSPNLGGKFEERMTSLAETLAPCPSHVQLVEQEICLGKGHLLERLTHEESLGGEGMMLRKPGSLYEIGRSHSLLKCKNFFSSEFVVVGYTEGKGNRKGLVGALMCTTIAANLTVGGKSVVVPHGEEVKMGSGLTAENCRNPPAIGTVVTGKFQELSDENIPRFPSFIGERID